MRRTFELLVTFYSAALGLQVCGGGGSHVVLEFPSFQLVVLQDVA
jgi:hypothetical protein